MTFTIPMAVTFEAPTPAHAHAMMAELEKLTKQSAVQIAIQGAAIRNSAKNAKTLVGRPEQIA
jgi:hypothetical protein